MRILFMGTPDFALVSLEKIYNDPNCDVVGIFTKPDKPNRRGKKIQYSPVKKFAIDNNIKLYQPKSLKDAETFETVKEINPDIIVVVAYGKILPENIYSFPKYKTINVHASLLPKYRGAAPIHYSIMNGEKQTGVSIMYIVEKLDAGDVILEKSLPILDEDTTGTLHYKLAILGAEALVEGLRLIREGKQQIEKQNEKMATITRPITKEECKIDWNRTSRDVYNFIRGLNPLPTAYTDYEGKRIKIYDVKIVKCSENIEPGIIVELVKNMGPVVKTVDGAIVLLKLKPENKGIISGVDIINGNKIKVGKKFN